MADYTRRFGYDTIRLNWELGEDATVFPMPSEDRWYSDGFVPPRRSDDVQLAFSPQLRCLDVDARGGGRRDLKSGGVKLWRQENGVHFELLHSRREYVQSSGKRARSSRSVLSLEASLPKLMWGHNKQPVPPGRLADAFSELTRRGRSFIACLPDVHELEAWRIDATCDTQLRSELELGLVARVVADSPLHGVLGTRYPTGGSVGWPAGNGSPSARCYGKSVESGDPAIAGLYRSEVQVMGGKQFRKALSLAVANGDLAPDYLEREDTPEWAQGRSVRCLRAEVLATDESVCTGLLGPLVGLVGGAISIVREGGTLTALEAIDRLEALPEVNRSRAVQLVGYSHIVRVLGWGFTGLNRKGVWDAKKKFQEAGIDPTAIDFTVAQNIAAGAHMLAGGAMIGAAAMAGAIAGKALGEVILPDKPAPGRADDPAPVVPDALPEGVQPEG